MMFFHVTFLHIALKLIMADKKVSLNCSTLDHIKQFKVAD